MVRAVLAYYHVLVFVLAASLVVAGIAQIYVPVAFIGAGLLLLLALIWEVPDA